MLSLFASCVSLFTETCGGGLYEMGLVLVPLLLGREGKLFSFNKSWFGFAGLSHVCSTEIGIFALLQASAYKILLVTLILIISASFLYRGQGPVCSRMVSTTINAFCYGLIA